MQRALRNFLSWRHCLDMGSPTPRFWRLWSPLGYGVSVRAKVLKTHTNQLNKVQNIGLRTIFSTKDTTPVAEVEKAAGAEPLESRQQAKLLVHAKKMKMPDTLCIKSLKTSQYKKKLNHFAKGQQKQHANMLTTNYNVHGKPKQLATRNPACRDQDNPWNHTEEKSERSSSEGWLWKKLTSATKQHRGHTSTPMVQLKMQQEMEDILLTSSIHANLQSPSQCPMGYCAQTTKLKSLHSPMPRKLSSLLTHCQPYQPSHLLNLAKPRRS